MWYNWNMNTKDKTIDKKLDVLSAKMEAIDEKFETMMQVVGKGFEEVHNKFTEVHSKVDRVEETLSAKIEATTHLINRTKLELLDKLASQNWVDGQELRIQHLEQSVATLEQKIAA